MNIPTHSIVWLLILNLTVALPFAAGVQIIRAAPKIQRPGRPYGARDTDGDAYAIRGRHASRSLLAVMTVPHAALRGPIGR